MAVETSQRPRFDAVTSYLSWDHERLGAILDDVIRKVNGGDIRKARELYRHYDEGYTRHIRIEEELLFPCFEARTGIGSGPTVTMCEEHRDIRRAFRMMREGLAASDVENFREGLRFLRGTLPSHSSKEEHFLYPAIDRLVSDQERLSILERLERE